MIKPIDESLQVKLNELARKLGVRRAIALSESALVRIPTVVGWIRPAILLPASALTGLSPEQLDAILAHELAHICRHDYLVNMLQTIVETLGFYHSAVWWISHKIRTEREHCCDDLAIVATGDRVRYARALTSMEEIRGRNSELAVTANGGNLFSRISRLVGKDSTEKTFSWIPAVTVILLLITLVISTTLALTTNDKSPAAESITNKSENEPLNSDKNDPNTKILIEAQTLYVTNDFLEQVGLDAVSLKKSNLWTQYRVDDSRNPSMFVIDSQAKERFLKNIDESEGSSSISHIYLMAMSGQEATIKNYSDNAFKSQEFGRFIKVKPKISQDGQSTYLDCELLTRRFENFKSSSDVSESKIVEYKVNAENARLSDDDTLLILGKPISNLEGQRREIFLIKTSIIPPEQSDDVDSKASSYKVANFGFKIGSKTCELLRIYLDLQLEPGQYIEIKDSSQKEPKLKQIDTSDIGKTAKDFPAYASYIDFEIRSNFDLNLSTKRYSRGSFFKNDKWDAYFTGPDTIIGNGNFSPTTLCVSAWKVQLWMETAYSDIMPSLVAIIIKPSNKPQESSAEEPKQADAGGESNDAIIENEIGRTGGVGLGTTRNTEYVTIDPKTKRPARKLGFEKLLHKDGDLWEIEKPYMDVYQGNSTYYITADKGQFEVETAAEPTTIRKATFSTNVVIHIVTDNAGKVQKSFLYLDNIVFLAEQSLLTTTGPFRLVSENAQMRGTGLELKIEDLKNILIKITHAAEVTTDKPRDETGADSTATTKALPSKMVTRVYDIKDLIWGPIRYGEWNPKKQTQILVKHIKERFAPESWSGPETEGKGIISPFPAYRPQKLAIQNTVEVHREIERFLERIRSGDEKLEELNIHRTEVYIETRIELVTDDFLKSVKLDPKLWRRYQMWSEYLLGDSVPESNSEPYQFLVDNTIAGLLLKLGLTNNSTGIKSLARSGIGTLDGMPAEEQIVSAENLPGGGMRGNNMNPRNFIQTASEPERISEGTFIRVLPNLTADEKNIRLEFELGFRGIQGILERPDPEKKKSKIHLLTIDSYKTTVTVPEGKILLIVGKLFRSVDKVEENRNALIFVRPSINPPKPASEK